MKYLTQSSQLGAAEDTHAFRCNVEAGMQPGLLSEDAWCSASHSHMIQDDNETLVAVHYEFYMRTSAHCLCLFGSRGLQGAL